MQWQAAGMPAVLHVSETIDGGVGVVLRALVCEQVARGWRVWVAAPRDDRLAELVRAAGGGWTEWSPGAKPGRRFVVDLCRLRGAVRDADPQLVHLHSSMAGLCGRLLLRGRVPTLLQPHSWSFFALEGPLRRVALAWERAGIRWATAVLCVSQDERAHALEAGLRGRFVVIPNGVDLERFAVADRSRARAALGLDDAPLAVCVGRLHRQKGQHLLLDAWPQVLAHVPQARLALVGDGPDRADLERREPPATTFVGRSDDVDRWLAAADLVVQPSVWEGMSLSLLEAMAAGRSVVVTDVPGMREVVQDGTGAVVPRTVEAIAAAVAARLQEPGLADAEGAEGRRLVEKEHDLRVQLERVLQLGESLLGGAR